MTALLLRWIYAIGLYAAFGSDGLTGQDSHSYLGVARAFVDAARAALASSAVRLAQSVDRGEAGFVGVLWDGRDQLDFSAFGFGDVGEVLATAAQMGANVVFELEPDTRVTVLRAELGDFDSGDFLL